MRRPVRPVRTLPVQRQPILFSSGTQNISSPSLPTLNRTSRSITAELRLEIHPIGSTGRMNAAGGDRGNAVWDIKESEGGCPLTAWMLHIEGVGVVLIT